MAPNTHCSLCLLQHAYTTHISRKLQVVYACSTFQTTALSLEMSIFWVRAACKIQSKSYGSKHTSQSLSDMTFCVHFHAQLENYRSYLGVLHMERLLPCVFYGVTWEIQLESYGPRNVSVVLWYNIDVHTCILQACTYIAIWCATMCDNQTHVSNNWILHTKWLLYCQWCIVYMKKLASTPHVVVPFQLIMYINSVSSRHSGKGGGK